MTGGTGFVGRHLVAALAARGDAPIVLTRNSARAPSAVADVAELVEGDPCEAGPWMDRAGDCAAIVHLAGESVNAKRWDARFRQVLAGSRIDSAANLVSAIQAADSPGVLVSASGIDYYPFTTDLEGTADYFEDSWVEEDGPRGDSFLAHLCYDWETEANGASEFGARVVTMRTGLVLGADGGPLASMIKPFKAFIGGRLGNGLQWTTWIHIDDAVSAYLHAIDTTSLDGPVNLVAPHPVRNREFAKSLGRALKRPSIFPTPAAAIRAAVGEFAEYIVNGRRARSAVLPASGFEFSFPKINEALNDLFK